MLIVYKLYYNISLGWFIGILALNGIINPPKALYILTNILRNWGRAINVILKSNRNEFAVRKLAKTILDILSESFVLLSNIGFK